MKLVGIALESTRLDKEKGGKGMGLAGGASPGKKLRDRRGKVKPCKKN